MLSMVIATTLLLLMMILGVVVLLNNPRSQTNRYFFLLILFIVLWAASNFLENEKIPEIYRFIFLKIDFLLGIFVALFGLWFSATFLSEDNKFNLVSNRKFRILTLISALFVSFFVFSDLIIKNIRIEGYAIKFDFGLLFIFYAFFIFFFMFGATYLLFIKYLSFKGLKKIQILYVLIGLFLSISVNVLVNLFLQNYVSVEIARFGIFSFIFIVIFTTYAIIKHHLMNVKVIATELFSILLIIISFTEILLANSFSGVLVRIFIFIVTLVFAIFLIRSVLNEVRRREEVEKLAKELKKTTKKLASANVKLKRLDEAKSEFLSIASHQLRTPSTIVKGYVSMILEGSFGKMSSTIKDTLSKVYTANERLLNLVENLLDISRIEAGRIEFDVKPTDLVKVVQGVVGDFTQKAKDKKLVLEFKPEKNIPLVAADENKVREVISNIIDNSVKYTKGGSITIGLHQESQSVVFTCQDTGIGIHPEDVGKLFEKFSRGQGMMKVYTEGTGLGMYYARKVVEQMGGRIWAESPGKNKGSKFSFSLPLADKGAAKKVQ